jgi:hypothetical protein
MNDDVRLMLQAAALVMLANLRCPSCRCGLPATKTDDMEYWCDAHPPRAAIGPTYDLSGAPIQRRLVKLAFPGGIT